MRRILSVMKRFALLAAVCAAVPAALACQDLRSRVAARIARAPARAVGLYFRALGTPDSLLVGAAEQFHAASTMKLPVMIQVFRDADAGLLSLGDSLTVTRTFTSLVDGSPYDLDKADDSDSSLYLRVGGKASIRELLDLMITRSSNLATNVLVAQVGAPRTQATARSLGAGAILVLRGVEDGKAYAAGLNNTTTARDLGVLLARRAAGNARGAQDRVDRGRGVSRRRHRVSAQRWKLRARGAHGRHQGGYGGVQPGRGFVAPGVRRLTLSRCEPRPEVMSAGRAWARTRGPCTR